MNQRRTNRPAAQELPAIIEEPPGPPVINVSPTVPAVQTTVKIPDTHWIYLQFPAAAESVLAEFERRPNVSHIEWRPSERARRGLQLAIAGAKNVHLSHGSGAVDSPQTCLNALFERFADLFESPSP